VIHQEISIVLPHTIVINVFVVPAPGTSPTTPNGDQTVAKIALDKDLTPGMVFWGKNWVNFEHFSGKFLANMGEKRLTTKPIFAIILHMLVKRHMKFFY
jgi:hypothetical protein